jgi:hypothetical protein
VWYVHQFLYLGSDGKSYATGLDVVMGLCDLDGSRRSIRNTVIGLR